jgi:cytochrome P450
MADDAGKPDIRTCPLHAINAFDPDLLQDPYPYFARLRAEAPVWRDPNNGVVYVSTYDRIIEVNSQPRVYSNKFGERLRSGSVNPMNPEELAVLRKGFPVVDTMLTADPPEHTRYRKLAMKAFTMKRVEAMSTYVTQVTHELIDRMLDKGACEFKTSFANHLPMTVIADSLGVPRADMDRFRTWSDAFIVQLGGVSDKDARIDAARKIVEFQHYFVEKIEDKRKQPTEDVISDLVHANLAEEGDPRHMEYGELLSIIQQLLVAGNETTAHSLTAGLFHLIDNPDQMAAVRADPTLVANFVEETLRFLTPTNNMWRVATQDGELGGVKIAKNDLLLLRYGSGNRDETRFPDPDRFDVRRSNAREHLAFGAGIHHCIGAQLARKEMQTAFPILLSRLKNFRFAKGVNSFRYSPNILLRGVLELHIEYDRA